MKKNITLEIHPQLKMLCSLLDVAPEKVIQGFIDDVSQNLYSNGSDERLMAADYFMRCCYGMEIFDYEDIEEMFAGLDLIRYGPSSTGYGQMDVYKSHVKKKLKKWHAMWKKEKDKIIAKQDIYNKNQ
jgi:hypothetical protein